MEESLKIECDNPVTADDIVECVSDHFYKLDEIIRQHSLNSLNLRSPSTFKISLFPLFYLLGRI